MSTVYCVHCVTASTECTGLRFLHQRQCPHHHISLFQCVLWFDLFVSKNNVPTTIYHCSTAYCIHCILWFDLFAQNTMSPPPYTTILLHPLRTCIHYVHCVLRPLHTASTASSALTFFYQRQCPPHYILLFFCIHCVLHLLHTASTASTVYCVHCVTASTESTGLTFLHQRQCLLHPRCTVSMAYCIHCVHCVLCPLCDYIH